MPAFTFSCVVPLMVCLLLQTENDSRQQRGNLSLQIHRNRRGRCWLGMWASCDTIGALRSGTSFFIIGLVSLAVAAIRRNSGGGVRAVVYLGIWSTMYGINRSGTPRY